MSDMSCSVVVEERKDTNQREDTDVVHVSNSLDAIAIELHDGTNKSRSRRDSSNLWLECEEPSKELHQYQMILKIHKELSLIGTIKKTEMSLINEDECNEEDPQLIEADDLLGSKIHKLKNTRKLLPKLNQSYESQSMYQGTSVMPSSISSSTFVKRITSSNVSLISAGVSEPSFQIVRIGETENNNSNMTYTSIQRVDDFMHQGYDRSIASSTSVRVIEKDSFISQPSIRNN